MQKQALEAILEPVQRMPAGSGRYVTIDVYTSGAYQMDCNLWPFCTHSGPNEGYVMPDRDISMGDNIVLSGNSTQNTAIFKETINVDPYGSIINIYSHHDKGDGRMDLLNFKPKK